MHLKIGELAKRTGVTIRALRHYDEIGLLSPSARSDGGFRLYGPEEVGKLYRIQALCRFKLPLAEVRKVLAAGGAFPDIVEQQIASLNQQIQHAVSLRDHLAQLQARHSQSNTLTMDDWLGTLAQMSAASRYFDGEEVRALAAQRASGDARCNEEKAALLLALKDLMAQGVSADDAEAQDLACRWIQVLMTEVGGDEGLLMKYYAMQWNEDVLQSISGIDRSAMSYISHAMAYRRLSIYASYCSADEIQTLRRHYIGHTTSWPPLIAAIRRHMADGSNPEHPDLRRLAIEWTELESKKVGGDQELAAKLRLASLCEPALRFGSGIDTPFLIYLDRAMQALPRVSP